MYFCFSEVLSRVIGAGHFEPGSEHRRLPPTFAGFRDSGKEHRAAATLDYQHDEAGCGRRRISYFC